MAGGPDARLLPSVRVGGLFIAGALCLAALAAITAGELLHSGFQYDEMWRIDVIRSDGLFSQPAVGATGAPLPYAPGWVFGFKVVAPLLPGGETWFRLLEIGIFAVGVVLLVAFLASLDRRRPVPPSTMSSWVVAACTGLVLIVLPAFRGLSYYFNNYLAEFTLVALVLWLGAQIGRRAHAFEALAVVVAFAPLVAIGSLVLVPPALLLMLSWARRLANPRRAYVGFGASAAVAGSTAAAFYLGLYKPAASRSTADTYWHLDQFGSSGVFSIAKRTVALLRDGVFGYAFPTPSGFGTLVLTGLTLAGGITGAVYLCRRWPWFGAFLGFGWLGLMTAGLVADWPVTPVRVNIGYFALWYVAIVFGLLLGLRRLLELLPIATGARTVGLASLVVLAVAVAWPAPLAPHAFAGLDEDLDEIAQHSPPGRNLVLAYHFVSYPYVHDRLINRGTSEGDFAIVAQKLKRGASDEIGFRSDAQRAVRKAKVGDTVWCVIPNGLRAEAKSRACDFLEPVAVKVSRFRGAAALIERYRIDDERPQT